MMMSLSITWSVFDSGIKLLIGVPEGTEIPLGPSGSAWKMADSGCFHSTITIQPFIIAHFNSLTFGAKYLGKPIGLRNGVSLEKENLIIIEYI